jgi:hypothetical protein
MYLGLTEQSNTANATGATMRTNLRTSIIYRCKLSLPPNSLSAFLPYLSLSLKVDQIVIAIDIIFDYFSLSYYIKLVTIENQAHRTMKLPIIVSGAVIAMNPYVSALTLRPR